MSINKSIRNLREQNDLTQEQLAMRIGMSTNGYAKLERGESGVCQGSCHPYTNQATKISEVLTRLDGRTGLSAVGGTGEQSLTSLPFQRTG